MVPLHWLRTHLREALLQNTLSLLIPFVAYAVAEQVHASGVLAVVVVALYLGHRAWEVDFATRLQEEAVWKMVAFVLESAVFALIGLQLPVVLKGLGEYEGGRGRLVRRRRLPGGRRGAVRVGVSGDLPAAPAVGARSREREGDLDLDGAVRHRLGRDAGRGLARHRLLHPAHRARRRTLPRAQPHPLPDLHHRHRHPGRPGPHPAAADPPAEVPRPRRAGRDARRGQRPGAGVPGGRAAPGRTPRRRAQRPARRPSPTACARSWSGAATPSGNGSARSTRSPARPSTTPTGGCPGR